MKSLAMLVVVIFFLGCSGDKDDQSKKEIVVSEESFDLKDEKGAYRIDTVNAIFLCGGDPDLSWRCLRYGNNNRIKIIYLRDRYVDIFYDSLSNKKLWIKHYPRGQTGFTPSDEIHIRTIEDLKR